MKKILSLILILALALTISSLVGCKTLGVTFPAVIRYAGGNHFIVEGLPENDINHMWAFQFSIDDTVPVKENGKKISATDLVAGDVIEITYTGSVLEISPAIIQNIIAIERVSTHDENALRYPAVMEAYVAEKTDAAILISETESLYVSFSGTYELPIDAVENASAISAHDRIRISYAGKVTHPKGDENGSFEHITSVEILEKAANGEVDPLSITAFQYDLVCNGVELSSGAVRNHDPEIMIEAFQLVRLGEEDVKAKFPAMYNAFTYGAPPHAGIAPGVDRMVMLLAGEDSIREIIPFPMNKNAQDVMMNAPSFVSDKQLEELNITCTAVEEDAE